MKPYLTSLPKYTRRASVGALACSCWVGSALIAADAAEEKEASAEETRNWVEVGAGGVIRSSGDGAALQRRLGLPDGPFGGIFDFHYEQDLKNRGLLRIDGHGLANAGDYGLKFDVSVPDKGYVQFGYNQFRTFYDGSGGYFPANGQWMSLYNEEFELDRGEAWFEAGLRMPDIPEFTVRYSHQFRNGVKDSTVWGDSNLTGGLGTRAFVPSFLDIDETRDILSVDGKHTIGNTDVGLGMHYEWSNQDNGRYMRRRPGERVTDALGNRSAERYLTQKEGVDSDLLNLHAFTETRLKESLLFTTGYSYLSLDTDLSGSRIYGSSYDAIYDPLLASRQQRDEGFYSLMGGSQMSQHVGNINLMWTPHRDVALITALRVEKQSLDGESDFIETNVGGSPGFASTQEEINLNSDRGILDVSGSLELRYTGITNIVMYARGYWMTGEGDLNEVERVGVPGTTDLLRDTEFDRMAQQYTAGLNWYPHRKINIGAQYYHKIRNEDYEHVQDTTPNRTGNRYPAFLLAQDFTTDDANVRVTFRPITSLSFVSRYDLQFSTIDMLGDGLSTTESAQLTSHIFSQSVSWTPWSRLGLQASVNYVKDETDTPASEALPTQTVLDFTNDYWFVNSTVTFVADDKTDITGYYSFYLAENYRNNSAFSMPYGAGAEEHTIGVSLSRKLTEQMRLKLRYGFFTYHDETSGGYNDFDGHLVSGSIQYVF